MSDRPALTRLTPTVEAWDLEALRDELDVVLDVWESGHPGLPAAVDALALLCCRAAGADPAAVERRVLPHLAAPTDPAQSAADVRKYLRVRLATCLGDGWTDGRLGPEGRCLGLLVSLRRRLRVPPSSMP